MSIPERRTLLRLLKFRKSDQAILFNLYLKITKILSILLKIPLNNFTCPLLRAGAFNTVDFPLQR
jgi:hypothetical protein